MARSALIDVQDVINANPLSNLQKWVIALCFLVVAIDGFDTALRAYSTSDQPTADSTSDQPTAYSTNDWHEQVLDVTTGAWTLVQPQHSPRCSCRALPEIGTAPADVRAIHSVSPRTGQASAPHA